MCLESYLNLEKGPGCILNKNTEIWASPLDTRHINTQPVLWAIYFFKRDILFTFIYLFFIFLAGPCDVSLPTRDRTHTPCVGSTVLTTRLSRRSETQTFTER